MRLHGYDRSDTVKSLQFPVYGILHPVGDGDGAVTLLRPVYDDVRLPYTRVRFVVYQPVSEWSAVNEFRNVIFRLRTRDLLKCAEMVIIEMP